MAVIKKFRIKSFKAEECYIELKNIAMFYDKREILNKPLTNLCLIVLPKMETQFMFSWPFSNLCLTV